MKDNQGVFQDNDLTDLGMTHQGGAWGCERSLASTRTFPDAPFRVAAAAGCGQCRRPITRAHCKSARRILHTSRPDRGRRRAAERRIGASLRAGQSSSSKVEEALARLCEAYWYPLYAYVRRRGHTPEDARPDPSLLCPIPGEGLCEGRGSAEGQIRSFLLASLNHFLADQWDREQRKARRRENPDFLDAQSAETSALLEPRDISPDKIFERRWALTMLEQAMAIA